MRTHRSGWWMDRIAAVFFVVPLVAATLSVSVVRAATVVVTTTTDSTNACATTGTGTPCSLRDAVTYANEHSGTTITFQSGLTGTITLGGGRLNLDTSMTITGPGADMLAVDGNNADIVFAVNQNGSNGVVVSISGLTIQHGNAIPNNTSGGGINVFIADLNLTDSAVVNNQANQGAGGIDVTNFTGHTSNISITRSTISGNTTAGIFNEGTLTVTNSTISGNTGGFGGIRSADGSATITQSTISSNSATNGGGVSIVGGSSVTIQNSIFSGNTNNANPADVNGTMTSLGHNVIGNTTGGAGFVAGDLQNVNPLLGPLQNNGGTTATQALAPASPALDAIPASGAGCPAVDQRIVLRPQGTACDIGAYELATTMYVDASATPGGNGKQNVPLQTIMAGIGNVTAGGTVYVAANTVAAPSYNERLTVDRNVTIVGAGSGTTVVDGTNGGTVVTINNGITASINGLTIQHGKHKGAPGGGIVNHGSLSVTDIVLINNSAGDGGGLYTDGSALSMTNSTVRGNTSASSGGGIFVNGGTVTIQRSTISGNTLSARGAGIYNSGALTLTSSTISGNAVAANGFADGVFNDFTGSLTLINCMVNANGAGNGAGEGIVTSNGGTVTIHDTIVAGQGLDIQGSVVSQGHNLIGSTTGGSGFVASDLQNVDPLLFPLALNAPGTTQTQALMPGSPAIDAGGTCPGGVMTDQRGIARPQGNACDIGAYEYQPVTPTIQPAQVSTAGQPVVFTGTGFQNGTTVSLGGAPLTIMVAADGGSFSAAVPAHSAGSVALVVTNPGTGHSGNGTLTYITPSSLPTAKPTVGPGGGSPSALPATRPTGASAVGSPHPLPPGR